MFLPELHASTKSGLRARAPLYQQRRAAPRRSPTGRLFAWSPYGGGIVEAWAGRAARSAHVNSGAAPDRPRQPRASRQSATPRQRPMSPSGPSRYIVYQVRMERRGVRVSPCLHPLPTLSPHFKLPTFSFPTPHPTPPATLDASLPTPHHPTCALAQPDRAHAPDETHAQSRALTPPASSSLSLGPAGALSDCRYPSSAAAHI